MQEERKSLYAAGTAEAMRNSVRFPLRLKVRVETEIGIFEAQTEDVSANGTLFRMDATLAINSPLEWTMVLPKDTMGVAADTAVHCIGRVVWSSERGGVRQVAAVIDSYRIGEAAQ